MKAKAAKRVEPATLDELAAITEAMPDRLRLLVVLSAWCALRFGEVTELRRKDVNVAAGTVRIRRGVVTIAGKRIVEGPKTEAGIRLVHIPPHVVPMLTVHLSDHALPGREGLLFYGHNGEQLPHSSLMWHWNRAKAKAGRPDLTPHALRHTGATLAAQSGATIAELMARLGHTTPAMAMRYQHAAAERDAEIARRLSQLADGVTNTPI
jgi:integrase